MSMEHIRYAAIPRGRHRAADIWRNDPVPSSMDDVLRIEGDRAPGGLVAWRLPEKDLLMWIGDGPMKIIFALIKHGLGLRALGGQPPPPDVEEFIYTCHRLSPDAEPVLSHDHRSRCVIISGVNRSINQ